ncbi:hypothetical protein DSL61_10700 [Vibrio cholerae]|uniref:ATP-binding protein n=1 Tax=Vibrio cholerae TaxID=666 RepID=UPI000DE4DBD2|nr:ATP-binding protein [Vibrio cholerae]RBO16448.1 hypothetical protein DSL61_10700 [Vibrio cholerae]
MSDLKIGYDAGRVCEAIARIGYEPYSAIMDIIDNSVTAGAEKIDVSLFLRDGATLKSRNSVKMYQIVDNGSGLSPEGIIDAFTLGIRKPYDKKSLSKYGMGLKSAGLSLGSRINIVSKFNGILSKRYTFDKDYIEDKDDFILKTVELTDDEKKHYNALIDGDSGTIVEIDGCEKINHASPKSTISKLSSRLGVVYYSFLKSESKPLKLNIRACHDYDAEFSTVVAKDILFLDHEKFDEHFSLDNYLPTSPYLALDVSWSIKGINGEVLTPINIKAVVFPQNKLSQKKSPLSEEDKKSIALFDVSRENKGFFIYRNGRLIRWGDDLEGLIGKDDINIRFRLDIETEHDDVLHVDVTKQRLEIDDENRSKLETLISKAITSAKHVREECQRLMKSKSDNEGSTFSKTTTNIAEDDPSNITRGSDSDEVLKRKKESAEEGAKAKAKEILESETDDVSKDSEFRKVIYSDKVPYGKIWEPHYDAIEGVFVCINKNHPYYSEFLSRFPESSTERLSLEALIFAMGLAESNVINNYEDISKSNLESTFKRVHQNLNAWLSDWSTENANLFDDE